MLTNSTCSSCPYQNEFGYCSLTACIKRNTTTQNIVLQPVVMTKCNLCECDLKDGDYLCHMTGTDSGIVFKEIVAHYCPVCGRKLKGR